MSYPVENINGFMVGGWMTPYNATDYIHPPELAEELEREVGNYRIYPTETFAENRRDSFLQASYNLLGKNIATEQGATFALKVMDFMREKLISFQQETGNNYNLEATPAEGTSYRLAKKDKEKHPNIVCANEDGYKNGGEPFYTNSTQLPVNFSEDIFEVLDLQDDIQTKYTGGTVIHLFVGEQITDTTVIKNMVKKICDTYHLPYFTFTPTFSVCPTHGYIKGQYEECPT